jgi:hypothetical protein
VTEPVARAALTRRTTLVATALVVVQAALCGVIGWVTFGPSPARPHEQSTTAPLAVAPIRGSTPSIARPDTSTAPATPARKKKALPRPSSHTPVPPPGEDVRAQPLIDDVGAQPPADDVGPQPPVDAPPSTVIAPPVDPQPAPDPVDSSAGSPVPAESTQGPVVKGQPCEPEGEVGVTAEDELLHCQRDADGQLRWLIN